MARPKSEDKRSALLQAAARVIDTQGLGAPTALIAKEAGLANGTLFNYFPTKTDLLNHLYLELKKEMAAAAQSGLSDDEEPREQFLRGWTNLTRWAVAYPEKRRTLAQLATSDEVTPETREEASQAMARMGALMHRMRTEGPMNEVPMSYLAALVDACANATMDFMMKDPANSDAYCLAGFEALWRVIKGP